MSKRRRQCRSGPQTRPSACTVADVSAAMESIAPTALAQSWDNVGLLAGDRDAAVRRVLVCIDLTPAVVKEAVRRKIDLVLCYHPPIFKPVSSLCADSATAEAAVFRCVQNGIAVYATHTALDAADGGTNDVLASLCGIRHTEPVKHEVGSVDPTYKLVVFVPHESVDTVAEAMFAAGAGRIGDYVRCSHRIAGQGTFFGGETTSPTIGKRGRLEYVDEIRLETTVPSRLLPAVVDALVRAHPYEEPAFDTFPLKPRPLRGIGRVGRLPRASTLVYLARRLKRATRAGCVQIVGPRDRPVDRAVIVVGAAGSLPFSLPLSPSDVIVTGEIRHHDALSIQRLDCTAIALGHWASERPVLRPLAERLKGMLRGLTVDVGSADEDPFRLA